MARTDNFFNWATDIANSIREKTNKTDPILASEFDTEIRSIQMGGTSEKPTIGVEFTEFDENGYPIASKTYGKVVPKNMFAVSTSGSSTPTAPDLYNNGFMFKMKIIDISESEELDFGAFNNFYPENIIGLDTIKKIGERALYLRGKICGFCLENVEEIGYTSIVQYTGSNKTSVWIGSSIKNNNYVNMMNEPLWVDGYYTPVDGVLTNHGDAPGTNTEVGYLRCTYNKIFDIEEFEGGLDKWYFCIRQGAEPIRRIIIFYDENYNRLKYINDRSVYLNAIGTPPDGAKYVTFHTYNQQAAQTLNDTISDNKVFIKPEGFNNFAGDGICLRQYSFIASKTNKIYIDLPRAVVEANSYYKYGFQNTDSDESRARIICNDDANFLTAEQFKAIDWYNYTD